MLFPNLMKNVFETAEKLHQSLDAVNSQGMRIYIIYIREINVLCYL